MLRYYYPFYVRKRSNSVALLLPDILARDLTVVFCGINPGMTAALAGHHFSSRSNRFWRVIHLAGFTPHEIRPEDDRSFLEYGCGLTTVVARPTRRAEEVSTEEFLLARSALVRKLQRFAPRAVAFLGKAAYSAITAQTHVAWGRQPTSLAGGTTWVVPNPSGLNRGFSTQELVTAYRELRLGVRPTRR
jgi:double-stranded uracil-DNA glycosylase